MGVPASCTLRRSASRSGLIGASSATYTGLSASAAATSAAEVAWAAAGPAVRTARTRAASTDPARRHAGARLPSVGRLVLIGILHDRDRAAVRLPLSRDSTTTVQHARVGVRNRQVPVPAARGVQAAHEPVVQRL